MLISKKISVIIGARNFNYFRNLGYSFSGIGDKIEIDTTHAQPYSKSIVIAKCDFCGKTKETKYFLFLKNIENQKKYACSYICASKKSEITCIKKYGTKTPAENKEVKEKVKNYFISEYGQNPNLLPEVREKIRKTKKDRYGDENYYNIEKLKKTNLEKYGVEFQSQTENWILKTKKTKKDRYGDENYNNMEKTKKTNLEKYGVEYYSELPEFWKKGVHHNYLTKEENGLIYQSSYEKDFMDYCFLKKLELQNGPDISYIKENRKHTYHSDFYLPKYNLICEIKSNYTYAIQEDNNLLKKEYSLKFGYNFLFIIDKNYSEIEKIINNNGYNTFI